MTNFNYHIKLVLIALFLINAITETLAQDNENAFQVGSVSYISGKNIYVKFVTTNGIEN